MTENESKNQMVFRHVSGDLQPDMRPIVIDYKKKSKKKGGSQDGEGKEKYSPGLKDVQRLEVDAIKMAQKTSKALSKGLETYDQERSKSAKKRKDGAMDDFLYNSAKATSAYVKETSDIPIDLMESVNRMSIGKRLRKNLRRTSKTLRMWRL
jgi:hypothetical protein